MAAKGKGASEGAWWNQSLTPAFLSPSARPSPRLALSDVQSTTGPRACCVSASLPAKGKRPSKAPAVLTDTAGPWARVGQVSGAARAVHDGGHVWN